jgi:hypothetical protein
MARKPNHHDDEFDMEPGYPQDTPFISVGSILATLMIVCVCSGIGALATAIGGWLS